jgi:uncharacterized protein with FMN-binding domain
MPTRAAVAIVATIIGVFLLFSFKTPAQAKPRTPSADVAQASATPSPSPSATDSPSATPAPTPTPNSPYRDGTYTGQDYPNQFGDTQVKVKISGGKIVDVQAIQLPFDRPRSEEISQYAEPQLHDEVLQAQSANIDYLSGATYTSYAYANSVQSALDQAKR